MTNREYPAVEIVNSERISVDDNTFNGYPRVMRVETSKDVTFDGNKVTSPIALAITAGDPVAILKALDLPFEAQPTEVRELLQAVRDNPNEIETVVSGSRLWKLIEGSNVLSDLVVKLSQLAASGYIGSVIGALQP